MGTDSSITRRVRRVIPAVVALAVGGLGLVGPAGAAGVTAPMATTATIVTPSGVPGSFTPVTPARVLDTRTAVGVGSTSPVASATAVSVAVLGHDGIPTSGVMAVSVTVTATQQQADGWLTAYPFGSSRPLASNVSWVAGETTANAAVVQVGDSGRISLFNGSARPTHVIVDVTGFWRSGSVVAPGAFDTVAPQRVLDTRKAIGVPSTRPVVGGSTTRFSVVQGTSLPTAVSAVVLNLTSTASTAGGFVSVNGPPGQYRGASALNWARGRTTANLVVAPVALDGTVSLYSGTASADSTHLIADLFGFVGIGPLRDSGTIKTSVASRVLDTRSSPSGPIVAGGSQPASAIDYGGGMAFHPGEARSVVVNLTVVGPSADGYLTAYATGTTRPPTSNLNFKAGRTVSATAVVPVGQDGTITVANSSVRDVEVLVDLEAVAIEGDVVDDPSWTSQTVPGSGGGLDAVSGVRDVACAAGGRCAVLGDSLTSDGIAAGFLQQFDSASGTWGPRVVTPRFVAGEVACAPARCVAAGSADSGASAWVAVTSGTGWEVGPSPAPAGAVGTVQIGDVACAAEDCFVAGTSVPPGGYSAAYIAHLHAGSWTLDRLVLAGVTSLALRDVDCAGVSSCAVVGSGRAADGQHAVAATWDGARWTPALLDPSTAGAARLDDSLFVVSHDTSTSYVAVGVGSGPRFVARSNAGAWSVAPVTGTTFVGGDLHCASTGTCFGTATIGVGATDGVTTSPVTVTAGPGAFTRNDTSLACPSSTRCYAVGHQSRGAVGDRATISTWTSGSWSSAVAPTPADTIEGVADSRVGFDPQIGCGPDICLLVAQYTSLSGGALKADVLAAPAS